jgi:hypothetical protein
MYRLHCANWAMTGIGEGGFTGGREVSGWRKALRSALRLTRESDSACRVYDRRGRYLLAEVGTDGVARILKHPVPLRASMGMRLR